MEKTTLITELKGISKSLFEKKDFQNAGRINLAIDVLEEVLPIKETPAPIKTGDKTNKFLNECEEMNCDNCKAVTGHVLKRKRLGGTSANSEKSWTCSICGNQKIK